MTQAALRDFITHHDDRWLFVATYIGLAVVLSVLISLFWLVVVAGLHFGIECLRQAQHRRGGADVVSHALWEVKLDIALVLLALALALYMELVLGVLGLQSAARATAATRAGVRATRFAAWQRNLRAILLTADDVVMGASRVLRRVTGRAGQPAAVAAAVADEAAPPAVVAPASWREEWSAGDRFTMALLAGCVLLIALSPVLTHHTWSGATVTLLEQLHPFPPR